MLIFINRFSSWNRQKLKSGIWFQSVNNAANEKENHGWQFTGWYIINYFSLKKLLQNGIVVSHHKHVLQLRQGLKIHIAKYFTKRKGEHWQKIRFLLTSLSCCMTDHAIFSSLDYSQYFQKWSKISSNTFVSFINMKQKYLIKMTVILIRYLYHLCYVKTVCFQHASKILMWLLICHTD